jgi:hypothetical protein
LKYLLLRFGSWSHASERRESPAIELYTREVMQKLHYINNIPLAPHWQLAKKGLIIIDRLPAFMRRRKSFNFCTKYMSGFD